MKLAPFQGERVSPTTPTAVSPHSGKRRFRKTSPPPPPPHPLYLQHSVGRRPENELTRVKKRSIEPTGPAPSLPTSIALRRNHTRDQSTIQLDGTILGTTPLCSNGWLCQPATSESER